MPKKSDSDDNDKSQLNPAREAFEDLIESAIEAEQTTGRFEKTEKQAKRSLIARLFSIFFGTFITILGLVLLVAPGPGLLVLAFGLGILAIDVPFARRLLLVVRNRLPQNDEGKITQRTIIIMVLTATVGFTISTISLYFTFF